jgi:predicted PurR-regulated permease PerM
MKSTGLLLVVALLYLNYRMFQAHLSLMFWAATYSTILRQISVSKARYLFPLTHILLLFPALSLLVLSSVSAVFVFLEVSDYLTQALHLLGRKDSLHPHLLSFLKYALGKLSVALELKKHEKISERVLYLKLIEKSRELALPILHSTETLFGFFFQFLFFMGLVSYFNSLDRSPLHYIVKPLGRSATLITKSYESILDSFIHISIFNFSIVLAISSLAGSPLLLTNALLATFFSVFPVVPMLVYSLPSLALFLMGEQYFRAMLFVGTTLVLFLVQTRFYQFTFTRDCVKGVSVVLGLRTFGLPGIILGPMTVSALLILWPGSPVAADEGVPDQSCGQEVRAQKESILKKDL